MKIISINEKNPTNEMLPQIMDKMFAICKHDKTFKSKDKLIAVEDVTKKLNERIDKQNKLSERGDSMISDVKNRIQSLSEANEKLRTDLLSLIGGE